MEMHEYIVVPVNAPSYLTVAEAIAAAKGGKDGDEDLAVARVMYITGKDRWSAESFIKARKLGEI